MAKRKRILKDGFIIESGYTKDGGYKVRFPLAALNVCDMESEASIRHRVAEFLLAAQVPEQICPKGNIRKFACEFD